MTCWWSQHQAGVHDIETDGLEARSQQTSWQYGERAEQESLLAIIGLRMSITKIPSANDDRRVKHHITHL